MSQSQRTARRRGRVAPQQDLPRARGRAGARRARRAVRGRLRRLHRLLRAAAGLAQAARPRPLPWSSPRRPRSASSRPTTCAARSRATSIPKNLKDATVAIEDARFYKHKGVDYLGVIRAAVKNLESGKKVQGGSTITMQLVRNLYITQGADLQAQDPRGQARRGARERALQGVDPRQVPQHRPVRHLGGQTALGVWAASRDVLRQAVADLTLGEAALLAGLPQAPTHVLAGALARGGRRRAATRCSPRWPSRR